jgi:hypothetical protein
MDLSSLPSQQALEGIIFASFAALPIIYGISGYIKHTLSTNIEYYEKLSEILSKGKNINYETNNHLTASQLRNSLVCIEGIVHPLHENSSLTSFDNTECVLILQHEFESQKGSWKLLNTNIEQKPWCLGEWESKSSFQNKKCVIIDQEAFRRSLVDPTDAFPMAKEFSPTPTLRPGGKKNSQRNWWDFFSPDRMTTQSILPTLTQCCFVGRFVINSDGNFLLTTHHDLGFLPFTYISFEASSRENLKLSLSLRSLSFYSSWSFKILGYFAGFLLFGTTAVYLTRKYHLINVIRQYFYPNQPIRDSSEEDSDEVEDSSEGDSNLPTIQSTLCVVCLDLQRNVLIKPCKHFCLCAHCAQSVQQCPVCRREIRTKETIYNV